MAYTLEQYTELQAAIAMGALVVRHNDRTVTYRSLNEMKQILTMMAAELGIGAEGNPGNRRLAAFSKGY